MAGTTLVHGVPEHVRSDDGLEMTAKIVRRWLAGVGSKTLYIEPGAPWENGYCESFNGNYAMNCSMARSSTASRRPGPSSNSGASTTTPSARAQPSAIDRLRRKHSSLSHHHWIRMRKCNSVY